MPKTAPKVNPFNGIAPLLVDVKEIATMTGFSVGTVRAWRAGGLLPPPVRVPHSRLLKWPVAEIREMVDRWANDPLRGLRK